MRTLADMRPGARGWVRSFDHAMASATLVSRLMEMGMTVGAIVEIAHEAPFGGAIAVKLRGSLIAVRKDDARFIKVEQA